MNQLQQNDTKKLNGCKSTESTKHNGR